MRSILGSCHPRTGPIELQARAYAVDRTSLCSRELQHSFFERNNRMPLTRIILALALSVAISWADKPSTRSRLDKPEKSARPEKKEAPAKKEITEKKAEAKKVEVPPKTHTLSKSNTNKLQLDAVFEAADMTPVILDPEVWMDLTVVEAVPHGAKVKKGDMLVKLDMEKITEQVEDLEQGEAIGKIAMELAVADLKNAEQTTPLKLEAAQRSQRRADEDYDYFQKTDRAQREKSVQFSLKSSEQRLRSATEELNQLKKMYDADDLTEETEEIILERQKFAVEAATFYLENARLNFDHDMKVVIPREHENLKSQKIDGELSLALAEVSLPKNLAQKRLTLEKTKREQKKSAEKLTNLKGDLKTMVVKAPNDGLVYYGTCEMGRWTTAAMVSKKLMPGGKIAPKEIFMTIISPDRLVLRVVVPEDKLSQVKQGKEGKATPVSAPDVKLPAKLEEIEYIPLPAGGFGAKVSVQNDAKAILYPGMNAKVSFSQVAHEDAVYAPKEAVFGTGDDRHVFVLKSDGAHEKRTVKAGEAEGNMIALTKGVAEGDKILLQKPE